MKNVGVAAVCLALAAGCASTFSTGSAESSAASVPRDEKGVVLNRIPGTESIDIPEGLSPSRALDAVELAVKGTGDGEKSKYWVSQWHLELRDPANRWIRIGLKVRQHYLCVCYRVEGNCLVPDVPTSMNLKQNGTSIHRKVPTWINTMKPLILAQMFNIVREQSAKK